MHCHFQFIFSWTEWRVNPSKNRSELHLCDAVQWLGPVVHAIRRPYHKKVWELAVLVSYWSKWNFKMYINCRSSMAKKARKRREIQRGYLPFSFMCFIHCLLMIAFNNFKCENEKHGHIQGALQDAQSGHCFACKKTCFTSLSLYPAGVSEVKAKVTSFSGVKPR